MADKENSELLPPPLLDPTVRRGDITQPFAMINRVAKAANLRMRISFSAGPNNNVSNTFGLSLAVQMFAGKA